MHKNSCSGSSQQDSSSFEKKHKSSNWTDEETKTFIKLCIEKRIIQMMDGKRHKHIDIYNSLEPEMKEMGFIKSGAQMKTKLKHLKEIYFRCKRNNNTSGASRQTFPFYDMMEQLYGQRPSVQAIADTGIDSSGSSIQGVTEEEAFQVEGNVEASIEDDTIESDHIPVPNNTRPSKKTKTGGRNTHMKLAENFAEVFAKKQAEEMQKVMKEQMLMFDAAVHAQMESQRQWEKEMMGKDQQHQMLIFQNFLKGLGTMQTANFQYPQFAPTSFPIHTFPSTSSAQNFNSYQLSPSPSLSLSPTPSSPFPAIPSPLPSPTIINLPETNVSMPSPTPSNSFSDDHERQK